MPMSSPQMIRMFGRSGMGGLLALARHPRVTVTRTVRTRPAGRPHPVRVRRRSQPSLALRAPAERGGAMRVRPVRLNTTVARLFMVGSACFVLGSVPAYADAVGGSVDGLRCFVGSVFFTSASFGQLLQPQTPAMTDADERTQHDPAPLRFRAWLPHDRAWLAAATQLPGTVFFNLSTAFALAHNLTVAQQDEH